MRDWNAASHTPIVIVEGRGAVLKAEDGREYLDGNSSIWTNLHGHRRPEIDQAIRDQLDRIAHSSFLGLTNDLAPRLARELIVHMGWTMRRFLLRRRRHRNGSGLEDGLSARIQRGETKRKVFVSLASGYHGDTVGAMSAATALSFTPLQAAAF